MAMTKPKVSQIDFDNNTIPTGSAVKMRTGTTAQHSTFTGADGEVTFDTDKNCLVTHDNETAGGFPHVKAGDLSAPSGSSMVGANAYQTQNEVNLESVSIKRFGGVCDGVTPDDDAMDLALAHIGIAGHIELFGTPLFQRPVTLPMNSQGVRIFAKSRITVACNHNGNGFNLGTTNENYGGNILENLTIQGPNTAYPGGAYTPPSTGKGINLQTAYDNSFINVRVHGFLYGAWLHTGFNNKTVGDCQFKFNQYGVYIAGGPTNLNRFCAKIRENRIAGVVIDGSSGAPYPTKNSFSGSYIESNIPYNAGYPVGGPGDGSSSVGVKLIRTYANDFSEIYFENQEYDFWLGNQASDNSFSDTRHAPSSDYSRLGKIKFAGASVQNNRFSGCIQASRNDTDVHVESDTASQSNSFINCIGFNFIPASILGTLDVLNNRPYAATHGTKNGYMTRYAHGYSAMNGEGSNRGQIAGIGTTTAVLNASGFGEVAVASLASATTIITISNLQKGQLFTLFNYQVAQPLTIKSSTSGTGGAGDLILKNRADAVMQSYGDSITFYVSGLSGKVVEVGRSIAGSTVAFTPSFTTSGGTTPAQTSTGKYVQNGKAINIWFTCTFTSGALTSPYYDVTIPFQNVLSNVLVGLASDSATNLNYSVSALTLARLRIYVTSAVTTFTGFATINIA